jgi:multidrug resistance efflux pump
MLKIGLGVTAGIGLLVAALLGLTTRGVSGGRDEQRRPHASPDIWISANGRTEGAREEVAIRAEISGVIRKIHVRTNDQVRQGALLVELENASQEAHVLRAEAQLRRREADAERVRDTYERLHRSKSAASAADMVQARFAFQGANTDCDIARAELRQARAEMAKTRLVAPWNGRVLRTYVEPGTLVGPGNSQPIALLADVSRRRVRAFVEELDALRVREGLRAVVSVDGMPGKEFTGRVSAEVLLRMDRDGPRSDAPGEYQDVYHRPVLIDLDGGQELPLNLRVQVRIQTEP